MDGQMDKRVNVKRVRGFWKESEGEGHRMRRGMACMSIFDVMYLCMCTISWDYRLRCSWSCHDARCFFVKDVRDTLMSQLLLRRLVWHVSSTFICSF